MDIFDRVKQAQAEKQKKENKDIAPNTIFTYESTDGMNFSMVPKNGKLRLISPLEGVQVKMGHTGFFVKRNTQKVLKICEKFVKEINSLSEKKDSQYFFVIANITSELSKFKPEQINFEYLKEYNYIIAYTAMKDEKIAECLYNLGFDFDALWSYSASAGPYAALSYTSDLFFPDLKKNSERAGLEKKLQELGIVDFSKTVSYNVKLVLDKETQNATYIILNPSHIFRFMKNLETQNLLGIPVYKYINPQELQQMIDSKTLTSEMCEKIKASLIDKKTLKLDEVKVVSNLFNLGAITLSKEEIDCLTINMKNNGYKMPKPMFYLYHHITGTYPDIEMFEWNKNKTSNTIEPTTNTKNVVPKHSKKKQLTAAEKKIEEIFDLAEENIK